MYYISMQNDKYVAKMYEGLNLLATGTSQKGFKQAIKNCKRNFRKSIFKSATNQ